jgi:hypothetical protein
MHSMYIVSKIVSARKGLYGGFRILSILQGKINAYRNYLSESEIHCIDIRSGMHSSLREKGRNDRIAVDGNSI